MFAAYIGRAAALLFILSLVCPISAGNKKDTPIGIAGDEWVEMKADIYLDLADIYQQVGDGMPKGIVVVKVAIKPRGDEKLLLNPEDFQLLSYHDGQKSPPYTPGQIASNTSIQLRKGPATTYGIDQVSNGPVWGGMGGSMPRQLPGNSSGVGSGGGTVTGVEAGKVEESKQKESPLLISLKEKQLKTGEIKDWTSGLLYFPLDGKQKLKDLVLIYKSPAGRLVLAFGR